MATEYSSGRRNSKTQLLEELESLSQSLYQSNTSTNRRTASLALPRSSVPAIPSNDEIIIPKNEDKLINRPRSRRMSLSPWRSRPKLDDENEPKGRSSISLRPEVKKLEEKETSSSGEKKGIWNWNPIKTLFSHIGMQKLSCLFSVEVVTVQGLPASMNGLRLSVCVRKKETKDGAVHTMPSRVSQGAADFEETLFLKCHVYFSPVIAGKQLKFESRPFWIYVFAVDAQELDFGKCSLDLSQLIQESMEKNYEGTRLRQWDVSFNLSGKAKGGELVLKLGFQIMEKDGGVAAMYGQSEQPKSGKSYFARKQSKTSFSVASPRLTSQRDPNLTPSQKGAMADLQGIDDLNLDEPAPVSSSTPSVQKSEEPKMEDFDLPDFEVVDKGVEVEDKVEEEEERESEKSLEERSTSSEVVKEVVHDQVHLTRHSELDSIAQQIKALESLMGEEKAVKTDQEETGSQRLAAEEETVTREFLQMLEGEETDEYSKLNRPETDYNPRLQIPEESIETESKVYLSDFGKGLGCVVQTRDGGYLAAMNPLDTEVSKKDTPKLAMQLSKPFVLQAPNQSSTGFELFQRMVAIGLDELSSKLVSLMPMEELMGKTAEQIAFEGIASAIIQGRNKEGASSSAARTIAAVKTMATALNTGRKERISTGIWNIDENPMTIEEILAISMQKIEGLTVEVLKLQAEMAEEEAPFDVSPPQTVTDQNHPLGLAIPLEDRIKKYGSVTSDNMETDPSTITLAVVVQQRDPLRSYEAVGGPVIALIHANCADIEVDTYDGEKRFKLTSLHVGGLKVRTAGKKNVWDTEKQRLTAMQWLVAYGLLKPVKKGKHVMSRGSDLLWSISSRIMADMWLKPMRNPDVKFTK